MAIIVYLLVIYITREATAFTNATEDLQPYLNLTEGNSLWTSLLTNCRKPTMACVETNMYSYLKATLDHHYDLQVTPFLKFKKNNNVWTRSEELAEQPRGALEDMSKSLKAKSVDFFMTHDMELRLPQRFFEGSTLKVIPRALEDDGALVKLEIQPPEEETTLGEGRIFFKKIKKYVSEKLLYALMAILLVIKLLGAKFMFFLPMMVGAVTAKKLLIKVLLFLFPALHHLFKLCAYVPHGTKFHHHKHHISHVHHVNPHKPHHRPHHHAHDGVEIIHPHADGPPILGDDIHHHGKPSLHHTLDIEPIHKPLFNPHEQELDYYAGGPALSHSFINHRQDSSQDNNEVQSWGQGHRNKPTSNRPLTPSEIEAMVLKAEKEAALKARLQQEKQRIQEENGRLQEQLRHAMRLQEKLKQQTVAANTRQIQQPVPQVVPAPIQQQLPPVEKKQIYSAKVKQEKKVSPFEKALHEAATITYDPFYSPILAKIDYIVDGLGFHDESCRERLICSMYKNPAKFSPHSNLLSTELSRDSKELVKPTTTNAAVVRFYRYVQAARDGQDRRDCLKLYPTCSVNTEVWNPGV